MSRTRVGLCIDGHVVSAIAVRRGAVVWAERAEAVDPAALASVVAQLLGHWVDISGSRVVAAVGPPRARIKPLHGIENVTKSDLALRAVQGNPERFFLSRDGGVVVSRIARNATDWYAAAFAADAVSQIAEGCAQAGATLELTVPARALIPEALHLDAGETPPPAYEEFADAYAAAAASRNAPLAFVSRAQTSRADRRRAVLRATLIAAVVAAAIANALAPSVSADLRGRTITAALVQERDSLRPVVATMAELTRTSSALADIERFRSSRRSSIRLLESLARELPESTAVLSLRSDTVNATIVLVTRAGPGVLRSLADVDGLHNPQVLGAFSREDIGGVTFERVSVRARLAAAK